MNKEQMTMLETYLKSGISPLLIEDIPSSVFEDAIVIDSNCKIDELNGHYETDNFCAPNWYNGLIDNCNKKASVLLIENINLVPYNEQTKFIEILKYKKISTFDIPSNCVIIVTAKNLKENPINEEIYSLVAHIK